MRSRMIYEIRKFPIEECIYARTLVLIPAEASVIALHIFLNTMRVSLRGRGLKNSCVVEQGALTTPSQPVHMFLNDPRFALALQTSV